MLFVHDADHLFASDLERGAGGDGSGRDQTQSRHSRKRLLAHEVAWRQQRDGGFLADLRNNGDLRPALLKIEDRVCGISLGEERLFWLQLDNSSTKAGVSQKDLGIKNGGSRENHPRASLGLSNSRQKTWGDVFGNRHHSPVPDSSMIGGGQSV